MIKKIFGILLIIVAWEAFVITTSQFLMPTIDYVGDEEFNENLFLGLNILGATMLVGYWGIRLSKLTINRNVITSFAVGCIILLLVQNRKELALVNSKIESVEYTVSELDEIKSQLDEIENYASYASQNSREAADNAFANVCRFCPSGY